MAKNLTAKQRKVIEEFFKAEKDESQILKENNVSRKLFSKWQNDSNFQKEITGRIMSARNQSQLIVARFAPLAALKLVGLMDSEKEETKRKACLDIINLPETEAEKSRQNDTEQKPSEPPLDIPQEVQSKLLKLIAESKK